MSNANLKYLVKLDMLPPTMQNVLTFVRNGQKGELHWSVNGKVENIKDARTCSRTKGTKLAYVELTLEEAIKSTNRICENCAVYLASVSPTDAYIEAADQVRSASLLEFPFDPQKSVAYVRSIEVLIRRTSKHYGSFFSAKAETILQETTTRINAEKSRVKKMQSTQEGKDKTLRLLAAEYLQAKHLIGDEDSGINSIPAHAWRDEKIAAWMLWRNYFMCDLSVQDGIGKVLNGAMERKNNLKWTPDFANLPTKSTFAPEDFATFAQWVEAEWRNALKTELTNVWATWSKEANSIVDAALPGFKAVFIETPKYSYYGNTSLGTLTSAAFHGLTHAPSSKFSLHLVPDLWEKTYKYLRLNEGGNARVAILGDCTAEAFTAYAETFSALYADAEQPNMSYESIRSIWKTAEAV